MTPINQRFRITPKKILLVVAVIALGKAYLWYFGLPPYYGLGYVYPGRPGKRLVIKIERLMADIRTQYPDPTLRAKVRRIPKDWFMTVKRPGLALIPLGLGALPYVEEMTRSNDPRERLMAYRMLSDFSTTGTYSGHRSFDEKESEWRLSLKYLNPIWERALYDPLPAVRGPAVRFCSLGERGIAILHRMLRDPDRDIRIAVARSLMSAQYNRADLVPEYLQRLSRRSEVE